MNKDNGGAGTVAAVAAQPAVLAGPAAVAAEPAALPDSRTLRSAFGTFATGVTVVTVGGRAPRGMTANSFSSVSLDPPLVLVCVRHDAKLHDSLVANGTFGVSVLAAHQEQVARHFAVPWPSHSSGQFEPVGWLPGASTGAPLIHGALAWFECQLWSTYDGGDHSIFVGRLVSATRLRPEEPQQLEALVFYRGQFRQLRGESR